MTNTKKSKPKINENIRKKIYESIILFFVILFISFISSIFAPQFLSSFNFVSIFQSLAPYALLSLGVVFAIASGGIDLSCGATCVGAAVIAGSLFEAGMPLVLTIPIMILFGGIVGLINGLLISKLKIAPFIATLGTMMLVRGLTAIIVNVPNVFFPNGTWFNKVFSAAGSFPTGIIWIILFTAVASVIFYKHKVGRYILAIGSNEQAAKLSGVDVEKYKIIAYVISGLFAGIAAIFNAASFPTISVASGNGMELDAIAGAFIGGCAVAGGSVNITGTFLGSLLLILIRTSLNFILAELEVNITASYVTYILTGLIIIAAVLLDKLKEKRKENSHSDTKKKTENKFIQFFNNHTKLILSIVTVGLVGSLVIRSIVIANSDKKESKTICLVTKSMGLGYWQSCINGAEACGKDYGYNVFCLGPDVEDPSSLPEEREIYSTMLMKNPCGIALSALADGFTDLLEKTYDLGIPVLEYDNGLWANDREYMENESKKNPIVGFCKTDVYSVGASVALEFFNSEKNNIAMSQTYNVGVIQYEDNVHADARTSGFVDTLKTLCESNDSTKGKLNIYDPDVKPSGANNAYKTSLEGFVSKSSGVDAIFLTNEVVVNQVYDAITSAIAAGVGNIYKNVKFIGTDAGTNQIKWIKDTGSMPELVCSVSQNPYELGYKTVKTLIEYNEDQNKTHPGTVRINEIVYTKENIDECIERKEVYSEKDF